MEKIIRKWYKKLGFPAEFDAQFEDIIKNEQIREDWDINDYDLYGKNGRENLLMQLYFCEEVSKRYAEKGIEEEIFLDTMRDIVVWTKRWSEAKGELWLEELFWLVHHTRMRIFKLGRLQFCMGQMKHDCPAFGVKKGDPSMEIHIPGTGEPLDIDECKKSMEMAKVFFKKHFPEYEFRCFTCHSWLLDDALKIYLRPDSNIIKFGEMFTPVARNESHALLKFIFTCDTKFDNLKNREPKTAFAEKIKAAVLGGEKFYEVYGVIENK